VSALGWRIKLTLRAREGGNLNTTRG